MVGIATHLCSHPNALGSAALAYPHSIVRDLRRVGYRTVLFQSPYESFNGGIRRFSELGFQEHYGALWQREHGRGQFVNTWGTCDRITFQSIADYLDHHRDEKIFIAGLTIDTHSPAGRNDYAGLGYPEAPAWIQRDQAGVYLRSVFRMDYDLKLFVENLEKRGLLDQHTVLIITADHSCPPFPQLRDRLGLNHSRFERIPWIFISKAAVPLYRKPATQLDSAPTLAYLAGLERDTSWWAAGLGTNAIFPIVRYEHGKIDVLGADDSWSENRDPNLHSLAEMFVFGPETAKTSNPVLGQVSVGK